MSSSVGMMKFPTEWNVIKLMFQITKKVNSWTIVGFMAIVVLMDQTIGEISPKIHQRVFPINIPLNHYKIPLNHYKIYVFIPLKHPNKNICASHQWDEHWSDSNLAVRHGDRETGQGESMK